MTCRKDKSAGKCPRPGMTTFKESKLGPRFSKSVLVSWKTPSEDSLDNFLFVLGKVSTEENPKTRQRSTIFIFFCTFYNLKINNFDSCAILLF